MSQATRSRMGIGAMALMGLVLAAAHAVAQDRPVTTTKDAASTVKVNVSGDMVLEYVGRSREVTAFTESYSNAQVFPAGSPVTSEPETTFEGHVAMRIAAELSEKIGAVIEFGTRRVDDTEILEHQGDTAQAIQLREAHIMLNELFTPELRAQLGITTWSFNVRGQGGALAFDPRHSQTITRNFDSNFALASEETINQRLAGGAFHDELLTMGAVLTYTSGQIMVDLVLLPGVVEGGSPNDDEALYALDLMYNLDNTVSKGSRVGVIAALSSFATGAAGNEHARVYTVGGGGSLRFMDGGLEVYAEGYLQSGKVGEDAVGDDIDAAGTAFQVGLQWRHTVGNPMPIWAGLNFTVISGDGDTAASADDKADRFSAYESINDLMILEDQYYGFDWDSNMQIFKINAGIALSVGGGKDNLEISAIAGIAEAAEEIGATPNQEDAIGNEFDVKVKWNMSKQASLMFAVAFLTGSDILESAMEGGVPGSNPQAEDNAYAWTIGANLRF